jgi:transposase
MEHSSNNIRTKFLDHYGLVAAKCKDFGIAEKIDKLINKKHKTQVVSTGEAAVAMIISGLGFTDYRLYKMHQLYENLPIEKILRKGISASDITDDTLGNALDKISEYGSSKLFAQIAFDISMSHNLLRNSVHLDTTSLSVTGAYNEKNDGEDSGVIKITKGYSKDLRPDLNQIVLSLTVSGPASIPIFMEPLDGNSSDKDSFHKTIEKVNAFKKQINLNKDFRWVADSALYSKDNLLLNNNYTWITRVPETIKEAKKLVTESNENFTWNTLDNGYKISPIISHYGGVEQRWIIVHSEQAHKRESITFEKKIKKKEKELTTELWHLSNQVFECIKDAESQINKIKKKNIFHNIIENISPIMKYKKKGRPSVLDQKQESGYKIESTISRNDNAIISALNTKGKFILATNDLDEVALSNTDILREYKEQQNVENGFRFLKDPWFMVDSVFLKSAKRIEALMMIMTLCLLVYNVSQYQLREALKNSNKTIPNQLNKQVKNPTIRWIFQLMTGVGIVEFNEENSKIPHKQLVTNMTLLRQEIIQLFGNTACFMYDLIPEMP